MLYWEDSNDVKAFGQVLGQHFTTGQLNVLADLFDHAADVAQTFMTSDDREAFQQLAESVRAGEIEGREDHAIG